MPIINEPIAAGLFTFFVVAWVRRWDRHSRSYYALNILADKHLILQNAKRPLFQICTTTDRISYAICLLLSVPILYTHRYDIAEMWFLAHWFYLMWYVLCVLMKRTNRKKSREHLHWIMFANIYTEFWAKTFVFVQRIFFLDSRVILNRLLVSDRSQCFTSCFCFWLYVFFSLHL